MILLKLQAIEFYCWACNTLHTKVTSND